MQDPVAARSEGLSRAFVWYLRWFFYRRFHAIRVSRSGVPRVPPGRPVIIYGNHPSWWDPALYIVLCAKLFAGRPGYGPMDAKSLGKYGVLRRMGVFGVDLEHRRGAAQFLSLCLTILANPSATLWITAEGEFTDPRRRPIVLRPGLAHLARRVPNAIILPLAVEYTFWNESKPEALVRFGDPIEAGRERSVAEWTVHLETELMRTMDALGTESMQREARLFQPLLHGRVGVGGVYDLYRRSRAWMAGRRFDPRHESHKEPGE